jgi:hypothetical protein
VEYILRLLGLRPAEAREIAHRPLPPLPLEPVEGPRQSRPEPTERKKT